MSKAPPSILAISQAPSRTAGGAARTRAAITRLSTLPTRLLLGLVALYQRTLSPALPAIFGPACGCRFYPTCSHYASEALRVHGALYGTWLALIRLLKCTPLHPGGVDPVPPLPPARRRSTRPTCARISVGSAAHAKYVPTVAPSSVASAAPTRTALLTSASKRAALSPLSLN